MSLYKFYLRPGETPPEGTTSIAMPDGGIVWSGAKWTADKLIAHEMSATEEKEYNAMLAFMEMETRFEIKFSDVWPVDLIGKLRQTIDTVKAKLETVMTEAGKITP
jgi:hypothetical protein